MPMALRQLFFVICHNVGIGIYEPPNSFIALHKNFQNSKNDIMTLISVQVINEREIKMLALSGSELQYDNITSNELLFGDPNHLHGQYSV